MADHRFEPVGWSANSNIYEVNLRQYTPEGTFNAFAAHLPRLKAMGVDILWLMPIMPISREKRLGSLGSYYAIADYSTTNPEFGSMDDFKNLVQAIHLFGMKVIIDWVANHTGWDHGWTNTHPEFYRRNNDGQFFDAHGWSDVIDLNYDNQDLRTTMIAQMEAWVRDCDIDGFRCDMAMLVPLDFWRQARVHLDSVKPLFWLAECEEINYHEVFDATYCWKFLHKMEAFYRKETNIDGLFEVLDFYRDMFPQTAYRCFFTTNHDENSHSGSEYERLGDAAVMFAVFCATWSGIPLIYNGQELPNRKRLLFFEKDLIEWQDQCALHDFYKTLLHLRKTNKALTAGIAEALPQRLLINHPHEAMAFARTYQGDKILVVLNLSAEAQSITLSDNTIMGRYEDVFTSAVVDFNQERNLNIQGWGFMVMTRSK
jgi:alpha-amylase